MNNDFLCFQKINYETSFKNKIPFHLIGNNGNVDLIEYLIDSGAALNARTKWGDAPIHYAACFSSYEAFKFLLEEGADLTRNDISKKG